MLVNLNNIVLIGEVPHDQISTYVRSFDVALIPYLVNEFTDSVYPCKLNEYLAMGLPIISSNLQEIRLFEEKTNELYSRLVRQILEWNGTISAEHGIGKLKKKYFLMMVGEESLTQLKAIKETFDPEFILGKGNIF